MVPLAVWSRALPCWNISLSRSIPLSICGCKISSLNFLGCTLGFCCACSKYCWPHHDATTTKSVHFLYTNRGDTHISTTLYTGSSITSLEKKLWLMAEPTLALVPQCPYLQCMTPTNMSRSLCMPVSKLHQHKVFFVEFHIGEVCCRLYRRKFSVNLGYQQQWL